MNKGLLVILICSSGLLALDYESEFCARTFSDDFYLKSTDTLREDVSVRGGNATIDGVIKGELAVMGGSVMIRGMIDGDVAVMGGRIENYGIITGDAGVAGGSIKNRGKIEGDIAVAGGTVELDSGSVVEGDIAIVGGSVERSDHAIVKGEITAIEIGKLDKVMPRISRLLKLKDRYNLIQNGFLLGSFAFIFVTYLLGLLCFLIFPSGVEKICNRIRKNIWIGIVIGIGIQILFVPLIILFVISLIGIPIIPAFLLAIFIGVIFGLSAFSIIIGEKIVSGLNWRVESKIGLFTIGYIATMIILIIGTLLKKIGFVGIFIWILGITILYVASTIGLGSALYALIKKKD
ncbi:MAG: polymer-forming cytoskeletal protein [candidate division WOR-3 bacterium]|nr:polymer-forming cytoskeletal protein [candidate division WOR-3 bacterium]